MHLLKSIVILFFCCASVAFSLPKPVQVNVLIFSHLNKQSFGRERWPFVKVMQFNTQHVATLSYAPEALPPLAPVVNAAPVYQAAPLSPEMQLVLSRMQRDPDYHFLIDTAFDVPQFTRMKPLTVYLDSASVPNSESGDGCAVVGLLHLSQGRRFLSLSANLLFSMPATELQSLGVSDNIYHDQAGRVYFRLLQKRRMRFNEVNYLDFPGFGLLVSVNLL